VNEKQFDAAITDLKAAAKVKPGDKAIASRLADALQKSGKPEEAIAVAKAAGLEVQAPTNAYRIRADAFQRLLPELPELRIRLTRYALLQGMQVAQTAGCNRLHDLEQRLGRWLLMCQDRVGVDSLPLTHELLSTMLGTDRPSVSIAAGSLQRKGVIEYSRGNLRILDRQRLQELSCECYGVIRQFNGLGPPQH